MVVLPGWWACGHLAGVMQRNMASSVWRIKVQEYLKFTCSHKYALHYIPWTTKISCAHVFPDPALPPGVDPLPPLLNGPLEFDGVQYRILQKPLDWYTAVQVCESVNGTLAGVRDPRQHAYLTLLLSTLRKPAWIGLHNDGVRYRAWLVYLFLWHLRTSAKASCISRLGATRGWVKRSSHSLTGGMESLIKCMDVVTWPLKASGLWLLVIQN